ncbi:MAG: hypothetical protein OWP43_02405 [Sphaerochaetaceae bacterium]|nr:hypothetical protein [Sphaerochaetaceae bacterium]
MNHILVKTILFAFIITSFTSFIGLRNDPSAARWLATVKDSNDAYFVSLNLKNIGGYSTVYSCVLIFPMIISMFKYKYIKLPYFIIIYLLFSLFLIYAQYTTALLLFFSSSVLIFLPKKLPTKKLLLIIFGSIIFLLIVRPFLGDLFYYFSSISNSIGVSKRLYVVGDLIKGIDNNSQANTRIPLITYDIQLFLKYPLFGSLFNASGENSGHSFILDILAKSGVFGAFSLFFMYRQIYKSFYSSLNKSPFFGYVIISYILVMITSIVNTGSWIFVLSFVIPLFAVHLNSYINFQLIQPHTIKG